MSVKRLILAISIAAGGMGIGLIGCERSVNSVERAQPYGRPQPVADKRIDTDPTLKEKAMVTGVHETMVGDLVKVQVDVVSTHNDQHNISYKFEWFDDVGMIVDSPMSGWKSQTILGRESISLIGIAPNARAKDFRLKMIEGKRD